MKRVEFIFSANSDIRQPAEHTGADDYLSKPFDLNTLDDKLNQVTIS